jgi:hypothetical protein
MAQHIQELKKQLSSPLREIPGVSGVGTAGGKLTVYLEQDLPGVKRRVIEAVGDRLDEGDLQFIVTGAFRVAAHSC